MTVFVQILTKQDGTFDKGTTICDTMNEAEIQYHTAIASAMNKPEYKGIIAMLINGKGEVIMRRVWER